MVTVGSVNADYTSLVEACAAGENNVRVITNITETDQLDLTGCPQFRIEIVPNIVIDNSIASPATTPWVIGDDSVLLIEGASYSLDLTTAGLSSQIVLQNNQRFRFGDNAELDASRVRFTGSGTNILLGGSSNLTNCRFDGATRFDLDLFDQYLFVSHCLFTVPVLLDSETGVEAKSAVVTDNIFDGGANITATGVNDLIFSGNVVGRDVTISNFTISGANCDSVSINSNLFEASELAISSTNLNRVTISGNIWARNTVDGLTISSVVTSLTVSNNILDHITISGAITNSTIFGNDLSDDMTLSSTTTTSTIFGNSFIDAVIGGAFSNSTFEGNYANNNIDINAQFSTSNFVGNHANNIIDFSGVSNSSITGNYAVNTSTFGGAVSGTSITSNRFPRINFTSTVTTTSFSNNIIETASGLSLSVTDDSTSFHVIGNVFPSGCTFSGQFNDSKFCYNEINGQLLFVGASSSPHVNGNSSLTLLTFSIGPRFAVISGNNLVGIGGNIQLNSTNSLTECNNARIVSNFCANITSGNGGVGGIGGCIINGNIISVSITATGTTAGNIVTSNRAPSILGFGGTDLVTDNI